MTILPLRIPTVSAVRRPALVGGFGLVGLIVIGLLLSNLFGVAHALQLVATLVVPALVMVGFWVMARERVLAREAEFKATLELERVTSRARGEFLAGVSHELLPHPERCNVRAEALAVAVDYRNMRPELKVAVPDVVVSTDPHLLRQVLHVLVGNAVRHGGERVAIWATSDELTVRLAVSDDGPGLPPESGAGVLDRYVDLAERGRGYRPSGDGLPLARTLAELIGGQLAYKKDPNWSHFTLVIPTGLPVPAPIRQRIPVEAGVR